MALVVLGLGLLLAGCGQGEGDDVRRTPAPTSSPAGAAASPCDVVSDAEVSRLSGRRLQVRGPEQVGTERACRTVPSDEDEPLDVEWTLVQADEPLRRTARYDAAVWGRVSFVDLAGVEAAVMSREVSGVPVGRVLTVVDDQLITVEATLMGLDKQDSDLTTDDLARIATGVARTYAERT